MSITSYRIYSKPNCPWCVKAARLLKSLDIPHEVKHINDEYERAKLADRFVHFSFPIIISLPDGALVGGYEEVYKLFVKEEAPTTNYPIDLKVEKINEQAELPKRGSPLSAGYDLTMVTSSTTPNGERFPSCSIHPGERRFIQTGLRISIPRGYYGRIAPRSGLAAKHGIDVLAGVIDEDYRGEVIVVLQNHGKMAVEFYANDRVAQLILTPYGEANVIPVKSLDDTDRSDGGFGSTGI